MALLSVPFEMSPRPNVIEACVKCPTHSIDARFECEHDV
jgi:hypothetical protein